jgi:2-polyprenyl-3-methyl-5-hydroxy-6-metoxy-1,4-benzoquinol methylase
MSPYFMSDRDLDEERSRLRRLEQVSDPATEMRMSALGIAPGWNCLEVGAGGGSIARWMAGKVGATGAVVATDLDPVFVEELPLDNLMALRHDIATEDVPGGSFDLVHCRDMLMHVSDATAALNRMIGALRPGGWLFIEEKDVAINTTLDRAHPLAFGKGHPLGEAVKATIEKQARVFAGRIANGIGYSLTTSFERAGLRDVDQELVGRVVRGGSPWAEVLEATWEHHDPTFLAEGIVTQAEINDRARAFADPTFTFLGYLTVATWGQRPEGLQGASAV